MSIVETHNAATRAEPDLPSTRLPRRLVASYGLGEFGKAFFLHAPNLLWLFFLTDVVGIAPGVAGLIILLPMVWDAVTDPLFGFIADRTNTRWGKYRPWLIGATPLCALAFVLFFTDPKLLGFSDGGIIAMAVISAIIFRTTLTTVDIPHNALLARSTRSSEERSVLAGAKMFANSFAMVAIAVAVMPVLSAGGAEGQADRFVLFASVAGGLAVITVWQNALSFRRFDPPSSENDEPPIGPREAIRSIVTNSYVGAIVAAGAIAMLLMPAFAKSLLYYSKYVLGDEAFGPVTLLAFTLATALSVPVWGAIGRRSDKPKLLRRAHMVLIAGLVLFLVNPIDIKPIILFLTLMIGTATGGVNVMTFALVPDVVEHGELTSGKRTEAGVFGCFTFSLKAGNGLGAGLLGLLLGAVGFTAGEIQTEETRAGILLIMTLLPIAGSLLVLFVLRNFDLGHAMHSDIVRTLSARSTSRGSDGNQ